MDGDLGSSPTASAVSFDRGGGDFMIAILLATLNVNIGQMSYRRQMIFPICGLAESASESAA